MFIDLLLSIFTVLTFFQAGLVCDYYLFSKRKFRFDPAIFLALGIGSVAVFQMALGLLGVSLNRFSVIALITITLLPYVLDRQLRGQAFGVVSGYRNIFKGNNILMISIFSVFAVVLGFFVFSH